MGDSVTAYLAVLDEPNTHRLSQIRWVAEAMGADFVVIGGSGPARHPFWFKDVREAKNYLTGTWVPLEVTGHSVPLDEFTHPERPIYLLGSQIGSLPVSLLRTLPRPVRVETSPVRRRPVIPTPVVAGIVLHHRLTQKVSA